METVTPGLSDSELVLEAAPEASLSLSSFN